MIGKRLRACGLSLFLVGCVPSSLHVRTPVLPPPPAPAALPPATVSATEVEVQTGPFDPWTPLAAGRHLTDCDYAPGIERWTRRLAASPERFAAELERVVPWVDWVWQEASSRGLPAEAALLPLVESYYRPVIGGHGAPGGWWQLMPGTARVLGLKVTGSVDERMDPAKATAAALGMLVQLGERYEGNWMLALIAYNVGPLHVDRWLKRGKLSAAEVRQVEQLPVPGVTREHLHRLIAFGCLIAHPQRYGLELPLLDHADRLQRVTLTQGVPVPALPAALGERGSEWKAQHPQLMRRVRTEPGEVLLAPADLSRRLRALGSLEHYARVAPSAPDPSRSRGARPPRIAKADQPAAHTVQSGDSLWLIARRYDLRVADLLALNPSLHRRSVLRLKQRIRLR